MLSDKSYLIDILESAKIILLYISNKTINDFLNDIQCQDSVIRRLEIIGEAAKRISNEFQEIYYSLQWKEMKGLRNILIHEYDEIDLELV